jgi:potassium-transporting ATPase KdpC subunit
MILKQLRPAIMMIVVFTLLTGLVYPLVITAVAQLAFPGAANGSLIMRDGKAMGSALIGQPFSDPRYFWTRPSATTPFPYNAGASTGSNYGPLNPSLLEGVKKRVDELKRVDPENNHPVPIDLVSASGSGLDPHISVAAALYQLPRVARVRGMAEDRIRSLVDRSTEGKQLGFLGEARVNVLKLNLALDAE